jgi:hypothetical protein
MEPPRWVEGEIKQVLLRVVPAKILTASAGDEVI